MSEQPKSRAMSRALKCVAFSVMGLLLAAGMCGLDRHLSPGAEFGGSLGAVGALVFVLSGLMLVGSVVALIVAAISQALRK